MHILYLVRHSIVDPASPRKELSPEGVDLARRCGRHLAESGYPLPEALYTSDRPRATQTAAFVAEGLGLGIGPITDTRETAPYDLVLPESSRQETGLPLTIIRALEENNPPAYLENTPEYTELTGQKRRPGLVLQWPDKDRRIAAYLEALLKILANEPVSLVASHGNIIQQALQELFPETLDLAALDGATPHVGLTVLTQKPGGPVRLNRLFGTDWR